MTEKKRLFEQVFSPTVDTSAYSNDFLDTLLISKEIPAGTPVTRAGEVEKHFYLVLEGVQMLYTVNPKGDKVVLGFSFAGFPTGIFNSFLTRKPSTIHLDAVTDSHLLACSYDKFMDLQRDNDQFILWRLSFTEQVLFGRLDREVELTVMSAKERFLAFQKRFPKALQDVPQKYLASYLNMTPETYSRLRKIKY